MLTNINSSTSHYTSTQCFGIASCKLMSRTTKKHRQTISFVSNKWFRILLAWWFSCPADGGCLSQVYHRCCLFLLVLASCSKISLNDVAEFLLVHCCLRSLVVLHQIHQRAAPFLWALCSPLHLRELRYHLQAQSIVVRITDLSLYNLLLLINTFVKPIKWMSNKRDVRRFCCIFCWKSCHKCFSLWHNRKGEMCHYRTPRARTDTRRGSKSRKQNRAVQGKEVDWNCDGETVPTFKKISRAGMKSCIWQVTAWGCERWTSLV